MADVISVTNSDSAFDASKGVTRTNLPPFAQRLRKAADTDATITTSRRSINALVADRRICSI